MTSLFLAYSLREQDSAQSHEAHKLSDEQQQDRMNQQLREQTDDYSVPAPPVPATPPSMETEQDANLNQSGKIDTEADADSER